MENHKEILQAYSDSLSDMIKKHLSDADEFLQREQEFMALALKESNKEFERSTKACHDYADSHQKKADKLKERKEALDHLLSF